ncbi:hypothetical protein Tco_1456099 [Tanacetum coccineum]
MIDQGVTAALAARDANRNGDDSHTSGTGGRRTIRTEGAVELTQWFERMETVFRISNCSVENQIKFSTCTLLELLRPNCGSESERDIDDRVANNVSREAARSWLGLFPEEF